MKGPGCTLIPLVMAMKRYSPLPLCFLFCLSGCLEGSTGPAEGAPPEILLHVTGGFAGVDFTVFVDGPQREVIGESCISGCDFEDGAILHGLTQEQLAYLTDLFIEAGVRDQNGTDFGNQCCDQFYYEVEYLDGSRTSTFQGSSELLPQGLREAVAVVAGFASGVVPVTVAPNADMESWETRLALVLSLEVQGDFLTARVVHEMGCGPHHVDLVVFGGWMESYPVQVRAFFASDDNGESCDTPLVEREVIFDLRPLKQAYQEAYGVADPGSSTVALLIHGAPALSSLMWNRFEYTF